MKRRSLFFAFLGTIASLACGNRCLARTTKTQRGPCVHSIDIARSPDTGSSPVFSAVLSDPIGPRLRMGLALQSRDGIG